MFSAMSSRPWILLLAGFITGPLAAQCPDGSLPPCDRARRIAAARAIPAQAERARRFLVLPFRNVTRAAEQDWLVEGSPILLADALGRWRDVSVVSDERLYPALRRQGLAPGSVMDLAKVRRMAEETNGWTAVTGDVMAIGGQVRISARAWDVVTSRELVRATEETRPGEDVRVAYARIGTRLLAAAGVDSAASGLEAINTGSLEAYRAYLRGVAHLRRSEAIQARDALLEAVRLDSAFAAAYFRLAEAELSARPTDILDLTSPGIRHMERAAALADRLPPRQRDLVRAIADMVHGRFTAARSALAPLLASDSTDVEAMQWLAQLETVDPLLVPAPGGGERPRGNVNTALRLLKRTLTVDPTRHQLYSDLVVQYAQGGGFGTGRIRGLRREPPSIAAMLMMPAERAFVPILRDTFELVPAESLDVVPADTLAASRRRAREAALAWARRWRQEAPGEAESWLWLSRTQEMSGQLDSALASLSRAVAIGVQTGTESPAVRRMSLLRRLERYAEARAIADSMWAARDFAAIAPTTRADAMIEVVRLAITAGDYERAGHLVEGLIGLFAGSYPREIAELAVIGMMSGGNEATQLGSPPNPSLVDSMLAAVRRSPPAGRAARWVPPLLATTIHGLGRPTPPATISGVVATGRALASHGASILVFQLGGGLDSTARAALLAEPWFQASWLAARDTLRQSARSFEPRGAVVEGDSVVFTWTVRGGDSITWNRPSMPALRDEYGWSMQAGTWRAVLSRAGRLDDQPQRGALSGLVSETMRGLRDTSAAAGRDDLAALLSSGSAVRASAAGDSLRVVVRQPRMLEALRRDRPATARFRFIACFREDDQTPECSPREVPITYR